MGARFCMSKVREVSCLMGIARLNEGREAGRTGNRYESSGWIRASIWARLGGVGMAIGATPLCARRGRVVG